MGKGSTSSSGATPTHQGLPHWVLIPHAYIRKAERIPSASWTVTAPGHAGKEGPQLARTGASQGFPRAAAPVGVKRSDGEPRRRPCRPARLSALCGGDAGAGRLIDCSAGLWGREGGGRGAFVCGVCASEASLGSAPGAAAVPNRGGALRGAGPGGGRRGRARGSPVVFGWVRRRVPGRGAPRSSPGTPARGRQAPIGLTQPRGSPRPFHFPALSLRGWGVGRA